MEYIYQHLTNASGSLAIFEIPLNFIVAGCIAAIIFLSYKMTRPDAVYSRKFNISLVMLTLVTTLVMSVIGNNVALSLGMVGALSIVRFRTAIKDPRDTGYIFWCIAVGICCGVTDYVMAFVGSLMIFIFLFLFGAATDSERTMLVIHADAASLAGIEKAVLDFFDDKVILRVKNESIDAGKGELIFELSSKIMQKKEQEKGAISDTLHKIDGIHSINMIRQDDEINQ